jgi:tetratricopeptide (TPR) repeat protein
MKKRPSPSPVLPQETLLEQGREFLRQGRSKEAVERFKLLVKRDPRPDWQALLYDAYVLRAQALADKGMVEEARLTLDNTRRPDGLPRQPLLYLTCLLRQQLFGKAAEFVQRCDGDWQEAIDADSRRRIVEIGAILALTDGPAEGAAATALDAWCSGAAADRVETALKGISLRSPLRPLRLILEALLTPEAERRDRLLGLVAADSPFAALRQAVVAAKADSGATLAEHWSGLSSAQQSFVAELRGLPPLRLRLWEQLRKAQTRSPQELLGVLLSHAKQFPPALLRCACADLLIDHPAALRQVENRLEPFSPMEKARIEALAAEAARDWPALKQAWQEVAELLSENGDVDGRLSLSLIYQHLADLAGKNPETVDEQADLLQKSLAADPEHLPTRYAWLQALQKQEDSEAWRQAIEDSLVRAPRDTTILAQAI